MLKQLGASGVINVGTHGVQVVVGPIADQVASDIRARLASKGGNRPDAADILAALGGGSNVAAVENAPGRVLVTVKNGAAVNEASLVALNLRGFARPNAD